VLAVVTGVAGSGKSSLIYGSIVGGSVSGRDGVVSVDQTPIRGSRRSNPATYTGLLDPIRSAFAKANGVKPALFSVLNIAEVLDLSVEDAVRFFAERTPAAHAILQRIADVGLGYLRLGQPLTTLSGGERQRLKLATHMGPTAASTCSTSRPPGCTWPISSSCSGCWTDWSTPASRSS
jgi:excinuclease UvrABC ATPase subunit